MLKYLLFSMLLIFNGALYIWSPPQENKFNSSIVPRNSFLDSHSMFLGHITLFSRTVQNDSAPKVNLRLLQEEDYTQWNAYVRYSIEVSDINDGESEYGEIDANKVLLEIAYMPDTDEKVVKDKMEASKTDSGYKGLELMRNATCFSCHADKSKHTGPSFSELAGRYDNDSIDVKTLAGNIMAGSQEKWGSMMMPAHPDFTLEETEQMAIFMLIQGGKKNSRIVPGLEGTFRTMENPANGQSGFYILTATYMSSSGLKGQDTTILAIK